MQAEVEVSSTHATSSHNSSSSRKEPSSSSNSRGSSDDDGDDEDEEEETAEVEMLLEAYFMHVDNTYNRVQTLHEYIQDTEDLVNLKLDQDRNQLFGINLILTAFSAAISIMTAVSGFFGVNLDSGLQ